MGKSPSSTAKEKKDNGESSMKEKKISIGVIFGGRSGEHEVSLMSARSVLDALDKDKYNITEIGIDHDGKWWSGENTLEKLQQKKMDGLNRVFFLPEPGSSVLYVRDTNEKSSDIKQTIKLDVVFPVLHGSFGEDGTIQGFFEMADIAYVGAGVLASAVGMDKAIFKDVMRSNDIPVVDWEVFTRKEMEDNIDPLIETCQKRFSFPMFIKPANMGSSVGITKAKNRSDLLEGLMEAARYDRRILVEEGLDAREIEVSVMGNEDPARIDCWRDQTF